MCESVRVYAMHKLTYTFTVHVYIYVSTCVYIYIYIYVCVCVRRMYVRLYGVQCTVYFVDTTYIFGVDYNAYTVHRTLTGEYCIVCREITTYIS